MAEERTAGEMPAGCRLIEVRVAELKRLFNAMDPSPFREKDLDPNAEEFILGWARELPANAPLGLVVHLERPAGLPEEAARLREAVSQFFAQRAYTTRRRLRQLFRLGRQSLLIGLAFLGATAVAGDLISGALEGRRIGDIAREGLLIGGWVAMWRPIEIFLYEWWPILQEARLFDRLATMPVRIEYADRAESDAWRRDWPAVAPTNPSAAKR
jgi:hypothetical protein